MVIGGGGTSAPSNRLFYSPPQCRVIAGVGEPDPKKGKRPPIYVKEQAPWSAVRNAAHSYGFARTLELTSTNSRNDGLPMRSGRARILLSPWTGPTSMPINSVSTFGLAC